MGNAVWGAESPSETCGEDKWWKCVFVAFHQMLCIEEVADIAGLVVKKREHVFLLTGCYPWCLVFAFCGEGVAAHSDSGKPGAKSLVLTVNWEKHSINSQILWLL